MEKTMNNAMAVVLFGLLALAIFAAVSLAVKQKTGLKGAMKNLIEIVDEIYADFIVICALILSLFGEVNDGIFFMIYAVYLILYKNFKQKKDKERS